MRTRDFSESLVCRPIVCYSLLGSLYPNCQSFGNLEITSPILQIRRSSRHLEGLRLPGTGSIRQAQENSSGHQGPAGRPIDRPRLWGSLGAHCDNRAFRGPQTALLLSVTQGNGTPGKLDLYGQIRCLPRQRHAGASDPGRPEDLMQTRNRLHICSCPAHALPVLLIPPPGGPTACPEGGSRPPDPGGIKAAPQEAQDRPGTAPQLREDLGPIGGNTATRGQQTAPQQLPALPCI